MINIDYEWYALWSETERGIVPTCGDDEIKEALFSAKEYVFYLTGYLCKVCVKMCDCIKLPEEDTIEDVIIESIFIYAFDMLEKKVTLDDPIMADNQEKVNCYRFLLNRGLINA